MIPFVLLSSVSGKTTVVHAGFLYVGSPVAKEGQTHGMNQFAEEKNQEKTEALVLQAQSGNENAVSALLKGYSPLMDSVSRRFSEGLPEEERNDLRQESVIAFCRALEQYDPSKNVTFGHFAKVCIENRLIDYLRRRARDPLGQAVPQEESPASLSESHEDDPARMVLERENYLALCEQIREALSDYENRIWTLVISGHTAAEIAERLGTDRKSVENAVARVRRKLRNNLPPR